MEAQSSISNSAFFISKESDVNNLTRILFFFFSSSDVDVEGVKTTLKVGSPV